MHVHSRDYRDIRGTLNSTPGLSPPHTMHIYRRYNTGIPRMWTELGKFSPHSSKSAAAWPRLAGGLLLSPAIKYPGLASTRLFRIHSVSKLSTLESGCKRLRIRTPDSPDICVNGSRIRKEKVADWKIPAYVWTGPNSRQLFIWYLKIVLVRVLRVIRKGRSNNDIIKAAYLWETIMLNPRCFVGISSPLFFFFQNKRKWVGLLQPSRNNL